MYTCDHCREQIWEDLFGLLEPGDSAELRRHVLACSTCRAELEIAHAEHRLVAAAARLDVEIPPFTMASPEDGEPVLDAPHPQPAPPSRRFRMMLWSAAAAALLMIGLPFGYYRYGRLRCQAAWRAAENSLAEIVKQREVLHSQAQTERENLIQAAVVSHLRLQAVGPVAYEAEAAGSYHVWVSDMEGRPSDAPVTARLLAGGKSIILPTKQAADKGQWLVDLPANLPVAAESTPCLELVAPGQKDAAPVRTYLRVLEPAYRTYLTIDKPIYQAGDTLHFRSLTLERFGLKIPDSEFTAVYTLADARGKELQTLRGLTRKDGIGGGDFALSPSWQAGEYTLTVTEAEKRFPLAACRLRVGLAAPNPGKAPSSDRLEVEFFPEGGDLLAEVENRVYFRVRSPLGQSADLHGVLVDSQGRQVVAVQTAGRNGETAHTTGLGMFTFRPRVGESYRLEVSSPQGVAIHAPFPPVRTTGVSLSLPNAVAAAKEPFRAIIQQTAPERNLVVGLFCRGRLVAQELVVAKTGSTEVRLTPTTPCSGVFRVTVFEERQGQLWPLAERLAYRRAEKRLQISLQADKENYAPGETVRLKLRTSNEHGKSEAAWVLVSVVNQSALSGDTKSDDVSLPAYFHLTSELPQPEELEQADILLRDAPGAAAALDLFLGTQGWRRFQDTGADTRLVMANTAASRRAQDLAIPAIVKLDNRAEVERRYATALSQSFADWHDALARRDRELANEGVQRLHMARSTAQELDLYEARAFGLIWLAVGLGGVAVFAAGCLLLAAALWRIARGLGANRGYLAGAFAALAVCAVILWRPPGGWGETTDSLNQATMASYAEKLQRHFNVATLVWPNQSSLVPSQAFSKAAGPLPRAVWTGKAIATVGSKPPSIPINRQPWIGMIRAVPLPEPRVMQGSVKNAPAAALPLRVYAYDPANWSQAVPDTILWQPILFTQNGTADVSFTLPAKAATYRILAQGHDAAGRLGTVQETLVSRHQR
jgi:hypothetical protein